MDLLKLVYTEVRSFQFLTFLREGYKSGKRHHLPSKSASGPHEDLRHCKCTTHLCLHRPQAAVVQRSSGQNNGAVSTYHHTLKRVKTKKDSNWIQDCLAHNPFLCALWSCYGNTIPPHTPFSPLSGAENDWSYSCFLPDKALLWKWFDALSSFSLSFTKRSHFVSIGPIIAMLFFSQRKL